MWEQVRLLEGPDLHAVDVEVLLRGQRLVVEGGAFGGGAPVQLGVQPQTQLTPAELETGGYYVIDHIHTASILLLRHGQGGNRLQRNLQTNKNRANVIVSQR